jgi:hypothetical protein
MAAKLTRLTHKVAIQLHLVAESCTICSSRSQRPVRKLLDTPSYLDPRGKRWGTGEDFIMRSFVTCKLHQILGWWTRHVALVGEMRNTHKTLVGKPEGKRPLGRRRCKWEDNIRMDLKEIWWEGVEWVHLAQVRDRRWVIVNTVVNLRVP